MFHTFPVVNVSQSGHSLSLFSSRPCVSIAGRFHLFPRFLQHTMDSAPLYNELTVRLFVNLLQLAAPVLTVVGLQVPGLRVQSASSFF